MLKLIIFFFLSVGSVSAITKQESKILNDFLNKYFKHDGVHYYHTYKSSYSPATTYEFTYVKWQTFKLSISQADERNGVLRKTGARLTSDSAYRVKKNGKWSKWKSGGNFILNGRFMGSLVSDHQGVKFVPSTPSALKNYVTSSGSESIQPVKKGSSNGLPAGVTAWPEKK